MSNSILSSEPIIWSKYGNTSEGLVVNRHSATHIHVAGWRGARSAQPDRIPFGFIPSTSSALETGLLNGTIASQDRPYIDFFIDSIQPSFQETVMPMKQIGRGFTNFVFGEEPPSLHISGVLAHTAFDNWAEGFLALYLYFLRASRLAELSILNKKEYLVVIHYQNKQFKGSIINLSKVTNAVNEQAVRFNMQFLVKEVSINWVKREATPPVLLGIDSAEENPTNATREQEALISDPSNRNTKNSLILNDTGAG